MTDESWQASSGRAVMLLGDEIVFRTRGWDGAVERALARFPDEIALIGANDLLRGGTFPSHPVLSRRYCEIAGGPCPANYIHDCIEAHIFDVFRILRRRGLDRLVYLDDVVIERRSSDGAGRAPEPKPHAAADLRTYVAWAEARERLAARIAREVAGAA